MKKPLPSAMHASLAGILLTAALPLSVAACDLRIGSAEIHYGDLRRQNLVEDADQRWELGARIVPVQVECEGERDFALRLDAPASPSGDTFTFGEHGDVAVQLSDVRIDDAPAMLQTGSGLPARSVAMLPGRAVSVLMDGNHATGTRLSAQLRVNPRITDRIRSLRDAHVLRLDAELTLIDN